MNLRDAIDSLVGQIPSPPARERLERGRRQRRKDLGVSEVPAPLHAALWDSDPIEPLFDRYVPLTVEGALAEKAMMDKLLDDGSLLVDPGEPPWWDKRWWPIASDGCGQLVCWNAESRKLIEFLRDDPLRAELGDGLESFFAALLGEVESGASSWRKNYGWVTSGLKRRLNEHEQRRAAAPREPEEINVVGGLLYLGLLGCVLIAIFIWLW